jgi:hypothetical protein
VAYVLVEWLGENAVAVMQQKTVTMVNRDGFTQLLQRPVRRRVCCHIAMHNTAGRMFHQDKDVEHVKGGRDHHAKVAGDDGLGIVVDKRPPTL